MPLNFEFDIFKQNLTERFEYSVGEEYNTSIINETDILNNIEKEINKTGINCKINLLSNSIYIPKCSLTLFVKRFDIDDYEENGNGSVTFGSKKAGEITVYVNNYQFDISEIVKYCQRYENK